MKKGLDHFIAKLNKAYGMYTDFVVDYSAQHKSATANQMERLDNMGKFLATLGNHIQTISDLQPDAKEEKIENAINMRSRKPN